MKILKKAAGIAAIGTLAWFSLTGRIHPVSLDKAVPVLIQAEIKGEVENPGVYSLKYGASRKDLIEAAGGESERADLSAIALIQEVKDGEVVVIPSEKGEKEQTLISINTASEEELQVLTGIGPALARRIVDYRQDSGFSSIEEIQNIKGIGPKLFEKIREQICL